MIGATCPACGYENEPDANFCAGCGGRLAASAPPAQATAPASPAPRAIPPPSPQDPAGARTTSTVAPPPAAARSSLGTAVFLELLPVLSLVAVVVLLGLLAVVDLYELSSLIWLLGLVTLVSGAGWISIGRPGLGCGLMAVRGVAMLGVFILLIRAFFTGWECSGTECDDSQLMGGFAIVGGIVAVILVPIASAIVLGVSARRRAASDG